MIHETHWCRKLDTLDSTPGKVSDTFERENDASIQKKPESDTSVFSDNQYDTSDPPNVTSVCKMTLLSLILVQIEKWI